jgi:MSHA biogenesis protein MshQ
MTSVQDCAGGGTLQLMCRNLLSMILLACLFFPHNEARAASTIDAVTLDGAATVTVAANATIAAAVTVTTPTGGGAAARRWYSTGWLISTAPPGVVTCNDHANFTGGTNSVAFNITAPAAVGTYNAYFIAYGADACGAGNTSATYTMTNAVIVVVLPPTVVSINRAGADPTAPASAVSWTVTFSESVTGVDAADFAIVPGGGVVGASITGVSGGGTTWTVTANTGGGTGTLGLNLVDDDTIINAVSTPLGGAGAGNGNFTGQVYTVAPLSVTLSPTACTNVAGIGAVAWGTLTGPLTSDNAYAAASVDGSTTNFLQCVNYGFAIPTGSTIDGITVNAERKSTSTLQGGSQDAAMRIVKAGVIGATDRSTATIYTTADFIEAHGGAADLWGEVWTAADINDPNFGAAFAATKANPAGAAHNITVDHMPITVTYTPPSGPDHILITHAGNALTCSPQTVTITACANAACIAPHYSGGVIVTMTPGSQSFAIDATGVNSAATVQQSTVGAAILGAISAPASTYGTSCWDTATSTASCAMTFSDSGFLITVPDHVSCLDATATIEAVETAPGTGRCVPAYQNVTRAVNLYSSYANPVTGTQVMTASTGVVDTATPGTPHNLAFDATGKATITLNYPDAGQLTLTANDTSPTGAAMTGSGSFVVAPASFAFSGIPAAPLVAGQAFNATVTAMNACGVPAATPNFDGTVTITSSNPLPGLGNATAINTTLAGFVNGAASLNLTWNEVGTIDLNADLASYLGSILSVSGTQAAVGRFQPAYFDTVVTQGCSVFTYSLQPFTVAVKAKRLGGDATDATNTANYAGAYAFASTISDAGAVVNLTNNTLAAADFVNGVGTNTAVTYTMPVRETLPVTLNLRAEDGDTPVVSSAGHAEGTIEIRSGRAYIANAHGLEMHALPVQFRTEYWSGGWILNADSCSGDGLSGGTVGVTLSAAPVTCVQDTGSPGLSGSGCLAAGPVSQRFKEGGVAGFAGDFNLWLKAPGAGNTGTVTVTGSVPVWLQYPWAGGAAENPAARATFGIYRGAKEFIDLRENY